MLRFLLFSLHAAVWEKSVLPSMCMTEKALGLRALIGDKTDTWLNWRHSLPFAPGMPSPRALPTAPGLRATLP